MLLVLLPRMILMKAQAHRVIQASGNIGGYMWGNTRKTAIIGWESAKTDILEM